MARWLLLSCPAVALALLTSGVVRSEASEGAEVGPYVDLSYRSGEKSKESAEGKELRASPRQLASSPVECDTEIAEEEGAKTVTVDEKILQAKFTCAPDFTAVIPDCQSSTKKCCKDAACTPPNSEVEILKHLGVKGQASKAGGVVTVTLEKVPDDKRGNKIFYRCEKASGGTCLVAVVLPGQLEDNECAIDRTITIPVSAAEKSVNFKCSGTLNETPFEVNSEKTCKDATHPATTALQLATVDKPKGIYKLTIDELPSAETKLCYKCNYKNVPTVEDTAEATAERLCSVMVTVSGKVPDGTNKTSTRPTSTESSAPSLAWGTLTFVTFALVALTSIG